MRKIYQYLLSGVANIVQLGKKGNILRSEANHIEFRSPSNALLRIKVGNASELDDAVSLSDLRERVLLSYGTPVQNITQLISIPASERRDKQIRYVEDERAYYQFDAESTEPVPNTEDPKRIFLPNDLSAVLPGRWIQTKGRIQHHADLLGNDEGNDHPQYQLLSEKNLSNGYPGLGTNRELLLISQLPSTDLITSFLRSLATVSRTWLLPDSDGTLTTEENLASEVSQLANQIASREASLPSGSSSQFLNGLKQFVSITWSEITGKPSNFLPTLHAHQISDVIDLESSLNGKADLVGGKVPASQLPSYVDDVLEYSTSVDFPSVGESGKIYIALDTNRTFRWTGSTYLEVGSAGSVDYSGKRNFVPVVNPAETDVRFKRLLDLHDFKFSGQLLPPASGTNPWLRADIDHSSLDPAIYIDFAPYLTGFNFSPDEGVTTEFTATVENVANPRLTLSNLTSHTDLIRRLLDDIRFFAWDEATSSIATINATVFSNWEMVIEIVSSTVPGISAGNKHVIFFQTSLATSLDPATRVIRIAANPTGTGTVVFRVKPFAKLSSNHARWRSINDATIQSGYSGLRRLDQSHQHTHPSGFGVTGTPNPNSYQTTPGPLVYFTFPTAGGMIEQSSLGTPRTGNKVRPRAGGAYLYVYAGEVI